MRRLLAPEGRHVGSKTLSTKNKAPAGRHPAAVLASVAPLGVYSYCSVGYYRYVAPLGLEAYGFA